MRMLSLVAVLALAVASGGCVGPFSCVCRDPALATPPIEGGGRESANLGAVRCPHYTRLLDDGDGRPEPVPNKERHT